MKNMCCLPSLPFWRTADAVGVRGVGPRSPFAPFLDLFVRESQFYFFPGEVWLHGQEMQICFPFLTVCLPSFPAPTPPPFYLCMPGMRFLQRVSSSVEELQKCQTHRRIPVYLPSIELGTHLFMCCSHSAARSRSERQSV